MTTEASESLVLSGLGVQAQDTVLINDVHLQVHVGELVALVGQSGAGKSLTARALVGALPAALSARGTVSLGAWQAEVQAPDHAWRAVRGRQVAWIPQDARAGLVPVWSIGAQLRRVLRHHGRASHVDAVRAALSEAGFSDPDAVRDQHPHALSGGMARRAQLALGLAPGARFLLADEPTTGLDRPVQVRLLQHLQATARRGHGVLLISHDLELVKRLADRVVVMHRGAVVVEGAPSVLTDHPHPAVARLRGAP